MRFARRLRRTAVLGAAACLLPIAACTGGTTSSAFPVGSVPTTGPLYQGGMGSSVHGCTASVLASPTQDLLITAAHCFSGSGRGMVFVPGTVNGSAPYGRWLVTAAYADPGWIYYRDPTRDVAVLRVAKESINGRLTAIQQLTGGNRLVETPATIGLITVPAYAFGSTTQPFSCLARGYKVGRYSAFDCGGYVSGTSGAPFIQGYTVLGVIGGLHQGGCTPSTSYSPPFDDTTLATYNRAVAGGTPDVLPSPGSDGC